MTEAFREHEFLDWLRRGRQPDPRLAVGIGDDAALFRDGTTAGLLLAIDTVVEGVHDLPGPELPERLARKALRSNVSDIAAMGGRPEAVLVSIALPRGAPPDWAQRITRTLDDECRRFGLSLAGGDTVGIRSSLVITVAITGRPISTVVCRKGARPGDRIVVTGALGGSILGRHVDFEPRLEESARLVELGPPTAMTDVSDGFLRDLANLLIADDLGALIDAAALPIAAAAHERARMTGRSALEHALNDGEDFELLFTWPESELARLLAGFGEETPMSIVGRVTAESGLFVDSGGGPIRVDPGGFDHGMADGCTAN